MMHLLKIPALSLIPALAMAGPLALLSPANAAAQRPPQTIVATWLVTWLAIPVIRGRFKMKISGDRYEAWFGAKSFGAFDPILRIRMNWYVSGQVRGGEFRPERFIQNYRDRREKRKTIMAWRPSGAIHTRLLPPESPGKRKKVSPELQLGTVDPMSALLSIISQPVRGRACQYTARIFEGRRRVNARLKLIGRAPTPIFVAKGLPRQAYHCHLFADRIAGFRPRHLIRFPNPLPPANIWFVRLARQALWVPVRIQFGTRFGRVDAYVIRLTVKSP
jgi:hypothetical protein